MTLFSIFETISIHGNILGAEKANQQREFPGLLECVQNTMCHEDNKYLDQVVSAYIDVLDLIYLLSIELDDNPMKSMSEQDIHILNNVHYVISSINLELFSSYQKYGQINTTSTKFRRILAIIIVSLNIAQAYTFTGEDSKYYWESIQERIDFIGQEELGSNFDHDWQLILEILASKGNYSNKSV